ncbi:MAG: 30S ribosomal protein S15, partial [Candidatus Nanohaloarchaea archaeon]
MARMHSDDKGQSSSSHPINKKEPEWLDYDEEEVIDLVLKLRQDGKSPSQIGVELRDTYGIPSVKTITGKKVTKILEENDMAPEIPEDLSNLVEKADSIAEHVENNPNDTQAER